MVLETIKFDAPRAHNYFTDLRLPEKNIRNVSSREKIRGTSAFRRDDIAVTSDDGENPGASQWHAERHILG